MSSLPRIPSLSWSMKVKPSLNSAIIFCEKTEKIPLPAFWVLFFLLFFFDDDFLEELAEDFDSSFLGSSFGASASSSFFFFFFFFSFTHRCYLDSVFSQ